MKKNKVLLTNREEKILNCLESMVLHYEIFVEGEYNEKPEEIQNFDYKKAKKLIKNLRN